MKNEVVREPGILRLSEFKGGMAAQEQKVLEALVFCVAIAMSRISVGFHSHSRCSYRLLGSPDMLAAFAKGRPLSDYAIVRTYSDGRQQAFSTLLVEVKPDQICYDANTATEASASNRRMVSIQQRR